MSRLTLGTPLDLPEALKSLILRQIKDGDVSSVCDMVSNYCRTARGACLENDPDFWVPIAAAMQIPVDKPPALTWQVWVMRWCKRFEFPFMDTPEEELALTIDWILKTIPLKDLHGAMDGANGVGMLQGVGLFEMAMEWCRVDALVYLRSRWPLMFTDKIMRLELGTKLIENFLIDYDDGTESEKPQMGSWTPLRFELRTKARRPFNFGPDRGAASEHVSRKWAQYHYDHRLDALEWFEDLFATTGSEEMLDESDADEDEDEWYEPAYIGLLTEEELRSKFQLFIIKNVYSRHKTYGGDQPTIYYEYADDRSVRWALDRMLKYNNLQFVGLTALVAMAAYCSHLEVVQWIDARPSLVDELDDEAIRRVRHLVDRSTPAGVLLWGVLENAEIIAEMEEAMVAEMEKAMEADGRGAIVTFSHSKQFISPPRINSPFTYTLTQEQ